MDDMDVIYVDSPAEDIVDQKKLVKRDDGQADNRQVNETCVKVTDNI